MIFEFITGTSLFMHVGNGVVVEPAAHAIGAGFGLVGFLLETRRPGMMREESFECVSPSTSKKAVPEGTA
jgi:hypothetical protein